MSSEVKGREQYVARLEEARRWLEFVLEEKLPAVAEFEFALVSGDVLGKVEKKFRKAFNPLSKEKVVPKEKKVMKLAIKGKMANQATKDFLSFVQTTGLPKKLCPQSKPPKPVELVFCLHGISHLFKLKGIVTRSVQDFSVEKNPLDLEKLRSAAHKVRGTGLAVFMPSFNIVGDLVVEELQSLCISLSQESYSSEEDLRNCSTSGLAGQTNKMETCIFDDPIYAQPMKKPKGLRSLPDDKDGRVYDHLICPKPQAPQPSQPFIAELKCSVPGVTVKILECPAIQPEPSLREGAIFVVNAALENGDDEALLAALRDDNAQLPYVHNNVEFSSAYLEELLKEKETHLPKDTICIYKGLNRELCETCMEGIAPGGFIVREVTNDNSNSLVISFRNQTVTKHWKVLLKDSQYCLSDSEQFAEFSDFIQHFSETLCQETKLNIHPASCSNLDVQDWKKVPRLVQLSDMAVGSSLTHVQIETVVHKVNSKILRERKTSRTESLKNLVYFSWTEDMVMKVSRKTAEKLLGEYGTPGSFIVRPSQDSDAYAISFRTKTEETIIHWKVLKDVGKYYIHPRPHRYNNLQEVVVTFAQNVFEKTGVRMCPPSFPALIMRDLVAEDRPNSSSPSSSPEQGAISRTTRGSGSPINQSHNCQSTLNPLLVVSWSEDDISHWLAQENLEEFQESFKSNAVDGECLLSLDMTQLKEDLKISALGHRHKILRRINALRDRQL